MLVVRFSALRLAQACTAAAVLGAVLLPTGAAADDVTSGQTVVGEIVQAWPEHKSPSEAAAQGDEGPLTWIQTPSGDAVRVPTDDLTAELGNPRDGVPVGATVQVVLGGESTDDGAAGKTLDPALDVLSAQVVAAPPADAPALPAAATDQVTVVMMIPAGGAPESGRTLADVEAAINGPVATFWSGQSGNTIRITTATGNDPNWVQATADCSDPYGLWNEAAAHANWTPGTGKHLLVYLPRNSAGCAYGLAQVGSSVTGGGKLYVTDVVPSLLAHELGHNFGLGHSSERQCELGTESGTCRDVAYRDYYDVMGVSGPWLGSLNAPQAARLGVLPAAQQVEVTSTSASARYTLSPYSGTTGVRAIKLTSAGGVDYWLEYRTATGQDSWLGTATNVYGLQEGVELRRATTGSDTSMLLDGTPSAAANWNGDWSVALPVGVPVAVTGSTFTVTVDSMTPTGATVQVGQLPTGNWESVSVAGPALTMTGWTFDPDAVNDAVTVQVDVDGQRTPVTADQSRPDVGAAFPGVGDGHGFTASTTVTPGGHHVCLYAVDVDVPDRNTALGCRTVTTQMAMPRGNWENVSAAGSTVSVSGWAFDPDDGGRAVPLLVHVDGEETPVTADGSRPDVGAAFPGVGDGHGFSGSISVAPGEHRVCVDAVNTDPAGGYTSLGCRTVDTQLTLPRANWEDLSAAGETITVTGWAVDADTLTAAVPVHVYVDGEATVLSASRSRPDVGAAFPGAGDGHGFTWSGAVAAGVHSVCVYAIDVQFADRNTPLGCRTVTTQIAWPRGNWEVLSSSGTTLTVGGWAFDTDAPTVSSQVHVYLDGRGMALTASGPRPDVAAVFPQAGADHGFGWSGSVDPGFHTVCAYAIDTQLTWLHTALGCRTIAVALTRPWGNWESLTATGTTLTVGGWAFDPDSPSVASPVHVYVDGRGVALTADGSRPDVGTAFSDAGSDHGFGWSSTVAPGRHSVCVYAVDVQVPWLNTPLGCRSVTT